jgi:threonine dehydrogenase-like Zn-dependent dehydrogenase
MDEDLPAPKVLFRPWAILILSMKTVLREQPGQLTLAERPMPRTGAGDMLIRVKRAGGCGTDPQFTHRLSLAELPFELPKLLDPNAGVVKALVAC